jgi:hypothetical protein
VGFIDVTHTEITQKTLRDGTKKEIQQVYSATTFCPECEPERAHIMATSTTPEERDERLKLRSHFKTAENYDKIQESKTRTL